MREQMINKYHTILLLLFIFLAQFNGITCLCKCENCTNKTVLKNLRYSALHSYEKQCESADYHIQIGHLTFSTFHHTNRSAKTKWILSIKATKNSTEVYNNLSTIDLPSSAEKAVECFHLPTQIGSVACRPMILPISSIYIQIECQNKRYNCPLEYRIETQCVRRLNIPKRYTWDVLVSQQYASIGIEPTSNLTIKSIQNQIEIMNTDCNYDNVFPSTVYAVYYEPIYSDRNDSWVWTINALDLQRDIYSLAMSHQKVVFGFITDQFPMSRSEEGGWHTESHVTNYYGTRTKMHTGYYCIDEKTRRWSGTLAGDDGHYLFMMYMNDVTQKDVIQIDIDQVMNIKTNKTKTIINVFKNNQTTSCKNYQLPGRVPRNGLYPVIGFNINGTVTVKRGNHQ